MKADVEKREISRPAGRSSSVYVLYHALRAASHSPPAHSTPFGEITLALPCFCSANAMARIDAIRCERI